MIKAQNLAFILRGKTRRWIYQILLSGARTLSEISKKLNITLANTSRTIKELELNGLIKNITPTESHGCLYELTSLALEFEPEFEEHMKFRDTLSRKNGIENSTC